MKFLRSALLIAITATCLSATSAAATTVPTWRAARYASLPAGGTTIPSGYLPALSCPSAGNCVAGGDYAGANGIVKGLILNEIAGTWRPSLTITAPVNAAANAGLTPSSVSCGSNGNCALVGSYQDRSGNTRSFVDVEVRGVWARAHDVALPVNAARRGQNALLRSIDCSSAGNCSAVGDYLDNATPQPHNEGFVLDQVAGRWRRGAEVRLPARVNANPFVAIGQLACASVGNCSAVGTYIDANDVTQGLTVDEVRGAWRAGASLDLPGNANAFAGVTLASVTCTKPGRCTAIGSYETVSGALQGLATSQSSGRWDRAVELQMPLGAQTNPHVFFYGFADIACPGINDCSAGGLYRDSAGKFQGFFVNERHGTWQPATELQLPSTSLMAGRNGGVVSVSCVSTGNCSGGAAYLDAAGNYQASIVNEVGGVWRNATKLALPAGAVSVGVDGGVYGLICPTRGECTAVGSYLKGASSYEGFTVSTK